MNHFAFPQTDLRSRPLKIFTTAAALLLTSQAFAQTATTKTPVNVALTQAAFLPAVSKGKVDTTIATDANGSASAASPWRVTLTHLDRASGTGGAHYTIQVTNTSTKSLNLPVGTNGEAVWSTCQKARITEIDFSLKIYGQPIPAANLPSAHSCIAIRSSYATVQPGASVIFAGTLSEPLSAKEGVGVSAVVNVCSASYSLNTTDPVTTRNCEAPSVSHSITQ